MSMVQPALPAAPFDAGSGASQGGAPRSVLPDKASPQAFVLLSVLDRIPAEDADRLLFTTVLDRMSDLVERAIDTGGKPRRDDAWLHPAAVVRILRRVLGQPAEDHSLSRIAAETGLSASACIRATRGAIGITPGALVSLARGWTVLGMIRADRVSVAEIARRCGYASASHLSTSFRRLFGMSPRAARGLVRQSASALAPELLIRRALNALTREEYRARSPGRLSVPRNACAQDVCDVDSSSSRFLNALHSAAGPDAPTRRDPCGSGSHPFERLICP